MSDKEFGYFNLEYQYPCDSCNGAGYTKASVNLPTGDALSALAKAAPNLPIAINHSICPICQGSGGGDLK